MNIESKLASLHDIVRWIDDSTRGVLQLLVIGDSKLHPHALMSQSNIKLQLRSYGMPISSGSIHAMMRILVESVVRGLWIMHCATDAELGKFEKRGVDKRFGDLTAEIEAAIGAHQPTLSQMKVNAWAALNDFTHTGYTQITRQHRK